MSFMDLAMRRYSVRNYEQRPVESEKIDAIVEAGRLAPSAHNFHPTRVIVCAKTADAWTRSYDGMNSSHVDTSIVCDQMMMEATDLGLGTCWVCAFDPEVARREFAIPEGVDPISILVVGYAQPRELDPERREARRIPLAEFTDVNA